MESEGRAAPREAVTRCQALIDELWDFDDPAASAQRLGAACNQARAAGAADAALELQTQVARALGLQRRFDEARAMLAEVERALQQRGGEPQPAAPRVRLLLERGRVLNSSGDAEAALPVFKEAHGLAVAAGLDSLAIDAAHMIAIVHGACSRAADAMTWNLAALRLAETSSQPRARQWRGSLHNNLGWALHAGGRFEEALAHFERALACRLEQGKPGEVRIARWCMARCLRSLGRIEEALAAQHELRQQQRAARAEEDGYIDEELGECLLALGRDAEAIAHFRRAHELLAQDAWLAEREPERIARLARLGRERPI